MDKLPLLARIAFICNLCFVITWISHFTTILPDGALSSSVIILGQLCAVFVNLGLNIVYWVARFTGSEKIRDVPLWLVWANLLFLLSQVYYYFFFNL
jgi:hypothetical protein